MSKKFWPAPAKINWFLHVVGKRDDGYHNLQTVFQFLDFSDDMTFDVTQDGKLRRSYDFGFSEKDDLCLRAARLLKKKLLLEKKVANAGVTIGLNKKIPMGGGLGGGSSNAATTLIALNKLWNGGLSRPQLADLGLQLGADVPVFVMGHAAWAEGIGDQLTPLKLAEPWFLVINPQINVPTKQIFCHKHLTARPQMKKIRALENCIDINFGENDLEPIVRAEYPEVERIFKWLNEFGKPRMSGSGGSVFMALDSHHEGVNLLSKKPIDSIGFVAKGNNLHPLSATL